MNATVARFKWPASKAIVFALALVLPMSFLTACSSNKNVKETPPFKLIQTTLAKGIKDVDSKDVLLNPTQTFTTEDTKVIAHVKFANLSGKHDVQWKWYGPDDNLYFTSKKYRFKTSKNKYVEDASAWHQLTIKGDQAENHPGDWQVKIFYDNALISEKSFKINLVAKAPKAPEGLPPILSISEISFSKPMLYAAEAAELTVTLKNSGPGDANDVYLELYSDTEDLSYESKQLLPVIPKKEGTYTVSIPIEGGNTLSEGKASLDVLVVEPHFRVKIKGKRLIIPTKGFRTPKLILARFAAIESESSARNQQIDINEVIDIKIAIQNVGDGPAKDVKIDLMNNQAGVMFLGRGEGQYLSREKAYFNLIEGGNYQVLNYRFFVNSDFQEESLEFFIKAAEVSGLHGFTQSKQVKINTDLQPEGYIRHVATEGGTTGVIIKDVPEFQVDVDIQIPKTAMHNPDAVAVVIGNRNYQHKDIPTVKYARHDADIMKQYLMKTLGFKEGNIILETDATKARFETLFGIRGDHYGILNDYVKPGKSDVFIYYSGHGAPDINKMKAYFVPADCDPAKISLNGYALDLFYKNITKMNAKTITVVLDSCFSGGTNSGATLIKSASPALLKIDTSIAAKENAIVLTSSEGDQISSWFDDKRHGLYTYFFLKAIGGAADMNNDSKITFEEVQNFVADRSEGVPYWAKRLHGGRTQIPTLVGQRKNDVLVQY